MDCLKNKTILVTGGTGSFGKSFVKHLLQYTDIKKIIVFSRDELKQFQMRKQLTDERLRFFIGDVRDYSRIQRALYGVDVVVHAAALKQVPTLEYNPFEAIKTNIIGSQNLIDAAIDAGVEKVLLVSTDKAAQPVNLYGSTKLCAEKLFISGNSYAGNRTKFSCVRYGNVIGSRGSIVEILLKNKNMDKVYITDEKMTRFWITLPQSIELVSYALNNMVGGEIFIPRIPSMKLVDLFDVVVPNAKKEIIGIRPGEKLHETLVTKEEARHSVKLDEYFVVLPEYDEIFNIKERFKKFLEQGQELPAEFSFRSDTNDQWLTKEDFEAIIKDMQIV